MFFPKKERSGKISYIFSRESFCYISEIEPCTFQSSPQNVFKKTTTLKKILIFRKIEPRELLILPSYTFSKESFFYILGNGNLEKKVYISGDGTFLYFQEKELSYISGKVYSEP